MRNRDRRKKLRLPGILAAAVLAAALAYQLLPYRDSELPKVVAPAVFSGSLVLTSKFGPAFAGELLALRTGLFNRENLRIEIRPGSAADDPIPSVVRGIDTF